MISYQPTRVLQVVPKLVLAGAERLAVHLACQLARDSFDSLLVSLYDDPIPSMDATLLNSGVKRFYLGKRLGFHPAMYQRLRNLIREVKPDLVHTHLSVLRYVLPVVGRHCIPIVHTVHNLAKKMSMAWVSFFITGHSAPR